MIERNDKVSAYNDRHQRAWIKSLNDVSFAVDDRLMKRYFFDILTYDEIEKFEHPGP